MRKEKAYTVIMSLQLEDFFVFTSQVRQKRNPNIGALQLMRNSGRVKNLTTNCVIGEILK